MDKTIKTEFLKGGEDFVKYISQDIKDDKINKASIVIMADTTLDGIEGASNAVHSIIGTTKLVRSLIRTLFDNENTRDIVMDIAIIEMKKEFIKNLVGGKDNE